MLSNRPRASTLAGASLLGVAAPPTGLGGLNGLSAAVRNRAGTMAGLSKHPAFLSSINGGSSDGDSSSINAHGHGYVSMENVSTLSWFFFF